jgi:prephenate dehydrogenase
MSEPGFFSQTKVCIFGLGLMGASLALALRGKCAYICAVDPDTKTRELATAWNIVDRVSEYPPEYISEVDLVIFAAPVNAIIGLITDLPKFHQGQALVIDLGSTKEKILEAMERLPSRFDPLGGHPMCGKERGSIQYAEASIFKEAPFALTALPRTSQYARSVGEKLALTIGAHPVWLDPETHDRWVAASSHLPYLISNSLAAITPLEVAAMISTGFRSSARLSVSNQEMMIDIIETNQENILSSLGLFLQQIKNIYAKIDAGDMDALRVLLEQGAQRYEAILSKHAGEDL